MWNFFPPSFVKTYMAGIGKRIFINEGGSKQDGDEPQTLMEAEAH
ncbi:hypothetical protein JCM16163A_47260 [Paenibacillus sp. YK5]|nr:hypothetical protein PN4B1_31100 [Paenibacillus naphthalenovorans]